MFTQQQNIRDLRKLFRDSNKNIIKIKWLRIQNNIYKNVWNINKKEIITKRTLNTR